MDSAQPPGPKGGTALSYTKPDPAERTVNSLLLRNAERAPDSPLVFDEAGTLTRGGALEMARRMSNAFSRVGLGQGDTVGIMLDNRREFLAAWFGASALGAIEVPLNPDTVGDRLVHALNASNCRVLVLPEDCVANVDAIAEKLEYLELLIVVGEVRSERFATLAWRDLETDQLGEIVPVGHADLSAIIYTSGSTGPAKGVMVSHGQHWTNGWRPTVLFDIGAEDVIYTCLPLYHNMAQGYGVLVALVSGAAIRIAPRFSASGFWDDVAAHRATVLSYVGAMLVLIAKQPEQPTDADNTLRVGFGVPIPTDLHEPFERRFGLELVHCYGSTEQTVIAWNHGPDRKLGSAGRPTEDFEVRIVDEREEPVPAGELGEICTRPRDAYSMFSGYWGDPERTATALENLWYHSGDRGRLDADGFIWFSDRMGDVIRHKGEFISSQEVENVIGAHPDVELVAAYGVPSELTEEEVMVAVVPRSAGLDAAAIRAWCAERMERFAVPRYVDFVEELPMTPTGKIEKYKLKRAGVTPSADDARNDSGAKEKGTSNG